MKDFLKSKKTTIIGIVAILGLIYHAYISGGFNVSDFLALVIGVGFIFSKDADVSHSGIKPSSKGASATIGRRPNDR